MTGSSADLLGIFAKQPLPGHVKTRLAAETSPEFAAELAEAFLKDTLEKCRALAVARFLVFAPDTSRDYFAQVAGADYALEPQAQGDLGGRMARFLASHRTGTQRSVLLGTDSPTLPLELIESAFNELVTADVVLGPATDGGYYLLGCRRAVPFLFDGMSWSGPEVLRETVRRIQATSLRLSLLPPWYDIDTLTDARMLRGHLAALRQASREPGAPYSEETLRRLP